MKVLITSLSAGSGHVSAAEAILAAIHRTDPQAEVVHIDVAQFVHPHFRRLYVDGYSLAVNHAPALWGRFYNYWDHQPPQGAILPLLHRAQRACATGFFAYLHNYRPDRIISTHFLIPQLLAADHRLRCLTPTVETVITDYVVHRFWVSDVVSHYYVAHPGMADTLVKYGVPRSHVSVSGIPVHPRFLDPVSTRSVTRDLDLDPRRPVILMLAGGLGLNELAHAVQALFSLTNEAQIITVAGKNEALRARLDKLHPPSTIKLLNLGFVRNMPDLLAISDLVITKPGGLTVSECLAKKNVMLLFSPIPGQEEKNAEYLVSQGAALKVPSLRELPALATRMISDRDLRVRLLSAVENCAHPQAAFTIAQSLMHSTRLAA